jgi:uncharacterized protein (DUF1499 family)
MAEDVLNAKAPVKSTKWAGNLGLLGAAFGVLGPYGTGWGFWPFTIGLPMLLLGVLLAIVACLIGLFALSRPGSASLPRGRVYAGLLASLGLLIFFVPWAKKAGDNPPIHDVTTDLANPPAFQKLSLRKDNLAGVDTVENWKKIHGAAFGDIKPLTLPLAPDKVIQNAEAAMRKRGWEVAATGPDRIEATETVSAFKFKDDVVLIATPTADGAGSIVNIRSVSRVGIADLGLNAARVRALIADLQGANGGE